MSKLTRRSFLLVIGTFTAILSGLSGCASLLGWRKPNGRNIASLSDGTEIPLDQWIDRYVRLYQTMPTKMPASLNKSYDLQETKKNSHDFKKFIVHLEERINNLPSDPILRAETKAKMYADGHKIAGRVFDLESHEIDCLIGSGLLISIADFYDHSRTLDPELSSSAAFQASRNIVTANSLQILGGISVKLNNATYAYSMLYPYTDNFLDDKKTTTAMKLEFSDRFRKRLNGEFPTPSNDHEKRVFNMVTLIEGVYSRKEFPEIYSSLLTIHEMQVRSLKRQKTDLTRYFDLDELLRMSVEKGGTSVMADAFLALGHPTAEMAEFSFAYGVALQLLDDLQDVAKDLQNGDATLFSICAAQSKPLDEQAYKLCSFLEVVLSQMENFKSIAPKNIQALKKAATQGTLALIGEAVAQHQHYYSRKFIAEFETHFPMQFKLLREEGTFEHKFVKRYAREPEKTTKLMREFSEII